ncbi:MAG: GMC family oxidoreductase [Deltaproteobacteria bacterium]|nr:GMC family oxidoreductase [Deltaproteobacteria bacterium]
MARLSPKQHDTLVAIAETALPKGRYIPAAGESTVSKVESILDRLPSPLQRGLGGLIAALDAQAWISEQRPFARVRPEKRLALLDGWRKGDAIRRLMLRALVSPLKMAHFDDPQLYRQLGCVYDIAKPKAEAKPAYMRDRVHDGGALGGDLAVECDVVVVGTGAGGAVVGRELAEQGLAVVFVEEGRYVDRTEFSGRSFEMQQKLYRRGGSTFSVGNVGILIPLGQSVGGSTTVNSGTCYRTPDRVLQSWQHDLGLHELGPDGLAPYFDRVEQVLEVAPAARDFLGGNGRVIERGCNALGFTKHGPLRRNAPACDGQGVCCFGCPTDAKRSTNVSYIPLALKAGAELFASAKMTRIIVEAGKAAGIVARTHDGHTLTIRSRAVVVACGSIMTPLVLEQAGLGRRSGQLGKNLSIHPACGALAEFDEQILPWKGIPQGYSIHELHDEGILYEGASVPLEMTMSMTGLIGPELVRLAESFDHVASFGFLVEDTSRGSVSTIAGQPVIRYWLSDRDVAHIKRGLDVLAQIYFAAGARRVHCPVAGFEVLESADDLVRLRRANLRAWDLDLSAYHPLGTARMGADPASSVVNADHQVHDTPGLYVVDGAAVPTSLGVNPQVTIMALATRAAEKIAHALA